MALTGLQDHKDLQALLATMARLVSRAILAFRAGLGLRVMLAHPEVLARQATRALPASLVNLDHMEVATTVHRLACRPDIKRF